MARPINQDEVHQQGQLSIENLDLIQGFDTQDCDFGLQLHEGRVWVCVNGIAFLRFRPAP